MKLTYIKAPLKRFTFQSIRIKEWIENRTYGYTLNLFAGKIKLNINEIRNDIDKLMIADYHFDALDFIKEWKGNKFNTVILDPPYSYRKAMEMYKGNYSSKFKQIADNISNILNKNGQIISFGYHTTFMGLKRGFDLDELCIFGHGGAQHATIAIIEKIK